MEPLTIATTFASIIGLLSNFKSERKSSSDDEYQDFVDWLDAKRHKNLMLEITSNHLLSLGIKSLLNQNHEVVLDKLTKLDETLLVISSSINGFKEISTALAPNIELSEQAISILNQLNLAGDNSVLECGDDYIFMATNGDRSFDINEPRFVKDDLEQLIKLNLLLLEYNSKGNRIFRITRLAVKLLDQM